MKFWKEKKSEPYFNEHSYCVEFFNIHYCFVNVESLNDYKKAVIERKAVSLKTWFTNSRFSIPIDFWNREAHFIKFRLYENYIFFRHKKEIIKLLDKANEYFLEN